MISILCAFIHLMEEYQQAHKVQCIDFKWPFLCYDQSQYFLWCVTASCAP